MRKDIFEVIFMEQKNNEKINYASIGRRCNCDPRTVKRYYENRNNSPTTRKKRYKKKVTDDFLETICNKCDVNAPAVSIFNFIKKKGYKGGYSSVKTICSKHKESKTHEATMRFETEPGLQSQVDWKESLSLYAKNNEKYTINIFLMILGYSRYKFIKLTTDMSQVTLFKCLVSASKYFGGFTKEILFDNMKTVIDRSRSQFYKPIYNNKFYEFSKNAMFLPLCCLAYRPQTKGKVETLAKIVNRLRVYDHEFNSIEELDVILKEFNEEINDEICLSTGHKPHDLFEQKEKEYLNHSINYNILSDYTNLKPISRKVSRESLINWGGKRYSVPFKYIGKNVICKSDNFELYIYYDDIIISKHTLSSKLINYEANHYNEIVKKTMHAEDSIVEICNNNLKTFEHLGE